MVQGARDRRNSVPCLINYKQRKTDNNQSTSPNGRLLRQPWTLATNMAVSNEKKHEVLDPSCCNALIDDQKKLVRQHPDNPQEWIELGRLHEARINLTNYFAKRNFSIRYFVPLTVLLASLFIPTSAFTISRIAPFSWQFTGVIGVLILFVMALCGWMWSLRYPPSGRKYFIKAIDLDPNCAEAHMYLGFIALRRYQKRKGCLLLEQAIRLGINNSRMERELKSLYEKEFMAFFNKRTDREIRQQEIIDTQQEQIRALRSEVASLERRTENLSGKAKQAKWEAGHKAKSLAKEMKDRLAAIRQRHEQQIANLNRTKESREEAKELAERDFVRLTTQIMEAKAALEGQTLADSARAVEDILGSHLWKTLSKQTRSYLATAEHIFIMLAEREQKPDYSLVGLELCKALETEINRTLVQPFAECLDGKKSEFLKINQTAENKGKPVYFTYLAKVVDQQHFAEVTSLTLGQYHFVLKRSLMGEYALKQYRDFLDQTCSVSEVEIGRSFLRNLETVTKRYRNTIAHQSPMNKRQCRHLRELIFAGKQALLRTCCRIVMEER